MGKKHNPEEKEETKMKKGISILVVLALVVSAAFATADLVLTTSVHNIEPKFKIEYDGTNSTSKGTVSGTTVTLNDSLADGNISVTFIVSQNGGIDKNNSDASVSGYSRFGAKTTGTNMQLTVTCAQFVGSGTAAGDVSKAPTVSATYATVSSTNTNKLTFPDNPATVTPVTEATEQHPTVDTATSIQLLPKYYGKKVVDQQIASVTAVWPGDDSLLGGSYSADITLTYTAQ